MLPITHLSDKIGTASINPINQDHWGEVILINGTRSSGKTTLVNKVIEKLSHFRTLNRKEHVELILAKLDELFFLDLLSQAREVTGKPVKDSIVLYHLTASQAKESVHQEVILAIGEKFNEIVKSAHFINSYNILLFTSYYQEMQPYLIQGYNYIIDEGLTSSDDAYATFRACSQDYQKVKRVLLYNTLQDNYNKCCARNNKFREFMDRYDSADVAQEALRKFERESKGSTNTYRFPKEIISNYLQYYHVKPYLVEGEKCLGTITHNEIEVLFHQIFKAQNELLDYLSSKNLLQVNSSHQMDVQKEIDTFCQGAEILYVSSKLNNDYILDGGEIKQLSNLEDPSFLESFLKDFIKKT